LVTGDAFLVQGLDRDAAKVAQARGAFLEKGLEGRVTAVEWDGARLPYVDNFVNLLVVDGPVAPLAETIRVVAPRGAVCVRTGADETLVKGLQAAGFETSAKAGWTFCRKPRPDAIDDWTHFLHGSDNNAVAQDRVVAPPRSMQWVGGPRYSRHHDTMSSISSVVTTGGRLFYIMDEAPPVSILTPPRWKLIARDAFNGTILWHKPITKWYSHMHRLKNGPADLPRKLVAVGDRVYVTLEIYGTVSALDAATGETRLTFEGTAGTEEFLVSGNTLFAQVTPKRLGQTPEKGAAGGDPVRTIVALDIATGATRWTAEVPLLSGTLAVSGSRVAFVANKQVVCLDAASGEPRWRSEPVPRLASYPLRFTPTLVLYDDVVLFAGGELAGGRKGNRSWDVDKNDTLTALSAETGKVLWTAPHPQSGYASSEDVLVLNGVVWVGETTGGAAIGTFKGYDVHTGEVVKQFDPDVDTYWFHHRCHRGKATENFLLMSRTGTEFVDVDKEHWDINHWVRGACLYGVMPANGLLYAPQSPCACFLESKQSGFNALAGARKPTPKPKTQLSVGPAVGTIAKSPLSDSSAEDWPTFRRDNRRSGCAGSAVPAQLEPAWTAEVGGRLSALTVAGGRAYVASIDRHTVYALDAETGEERWRYTAGGRVDSPPTCWRNGVFFGSADGHVTCLNAANGAVAWRFRAAAGPEQTMAYEQLESVWPVHGSVLIQDDVLYLVAGRSIFLDGGLRLFRLNPADGSVLSVTVLDKEDRQQKKMVQDYTRQLNMPVALPDILSCDGKFVYMRSQPFELDGTRLPLEALSYTAESPERFGITMVQKPEQAHLFSPTGFLDDAWWHRSYWVYGSHFFGGWSGYIRAGKFVPAGKVLVMDDQYVYGFGREMKYYKWTNPIEHMLYAASRDLAPLKMLPADRAEDEKNKARKHLWNKKMPLFARGLLVSGDHLFVAGPEDIVDEEKLARQWNAPEAVKRIQRQSRLFTGKEGGMLWVVNKKTGEKTAELKLDTIPVFDGLAAARGRLYIAGVDGRVACFK